MDYTGVTEVPGDHISREAVSMLYTRYQYASQFCEYKDVLEVACGAGTGLGYLAKTARRVVGGDYTEDLVRKAHNHYKERIPLLRLDAHALPFQALSFDVVLLYEAIYYLAQPEVFLDECRRVLREQGLVLICTVNKMWADLNPSPLSTAYFSSQELGILLRKGQFNPEIYGAFPVQGKSLRGSLISWLKRVAVTLHLIPKTMRSKAFLKRIFLGPVTKLQPEVFDGMGTYVDPVPLSNDSPSNQFKVIFAVARLD